MRVYKFDNTVLKIFGNATHFLNGLTSNSLDQHLNAFLNLHGRIIAVCFVQKQAEDSYLLSVPNIAVDALSQHLSRYAKLSHTAIEKLDLNSYIDLDLGQIILSKEELGSDVSLEEFTLFRLKKNLPLMGIDFQADEFILNIDELDYTSYTKGCFLGQEPVAKVHNRSKPSRKLVVKFEDECPPEEAARMTSKVKDPATSRIKGFVFLPNS